MGVDHTGDFSGGGGTGAYSKKHKVVFRFKAFGSLFFDSDYCENI